MRRGTFCSIPCPAKKGFINAHAREWLQERFNEIGGIVIKQYGKDGKTPSFEIDCPEDIDRIDTEDTSILNEDELKRRDDWIDRASDIKIEYYKEYNI